MPSRRPERRRRPARRRCAPAVAALALVALVAAAASAGAAPATGSSAPPAVAPGQGQDPGGAPLPTPEPDPDDVRAEADRILGGSEFGGDDGQLPEDGPASGGGGDADPLTGPEVPQPAPFEGLGAIGTAVMWVVVVAVVAAAAWVLVRALARRRRSRSGEGDGPDEGAEVVDELLVDEHGRRRPADEWLQLAEQAEAEGRWRDGLRCRYASLVVALLERGVLDDVPGRTTGEHRAEVAVAAPGVAGDFADAAELFDRAWYGGLPTGPDEAGRTAAAAARVLAATDPDRATTGAAR